MRLNASDRVHLPFRQSGGWSTGTVIYADAERFRVTWDSPLDPSGRPHRPRVRTWHKQSEAHRFRLGNPGPDTE